MYYLGVIAGCFWEGYQVAELAGQGLAGLAGGRRVIWGFGMGASRKMAVDGRALGQA